MKTEDILSKCNICGIASDEVRFAKELLSSRSSISVSPSALSLWRVIYTVTLFLRR